MKIVLNRDYGSYGLSEKAAQFLGLHNTPGTTDSDYVGHMYYNYDADRTNPKLIECVETLGSKASGDFACLEVIEIPDEATDYTINNYDGWETIFYVLNGKIYEK